MRRLSQTHKIDVFPENSGVVYQIVVKANKDQFVVSIDSSGESLHKRGYRTQATLAAMVKLSDWKPERRLVDPFCGSGTILIEAAMIARNIAQGLKREFAFQKWAWMDSKKIAEARPSRSSANTLMRQNGASFFGYDIDPNAIKIAQENAARAGFEDLKFECRDFNDLNFAEFENCTFITNPPYGERLEEKPQVQEMYRNFGKKFAQSKNCSLESFPGLFGKKADKNRKLFNGQIRCYLPKTTRSLPFLGFACCLLAHPALRDASWWAVQDSNLWPQQCQCCALTN